MTYVIHSMFSQFKILFIFTVNVVKTFEWIWQTTLLNLFFAIHGLLLILHFFFHSVADFHQIPKHFTGFKFQSFLILLTYLGDTVATHF